MLRPWGCSNHPGGSELARKMGPAGGLLIYNSLGQRGPFPGLVAGRWGSFVPGVSQPCFRKRLQGAAIITMIITQGKHRNRPRLTDRSLFYSVTLHPAGWLLASPLYRLANRGSKPWSHSPLCKRPSQEALRAETANSLTFFPTVPHLVPLKYF